MQRVLAFSQRAEVLKQLGLFTVHAEASQHEERSASVPLEFFLPGLFVLLPGAQSSPDNPYSLCLGTRLFSKGAGVDPSSEAEVV